MAEIGRQTPTKSIVLPYTETKGQDAIDRYNATGRTAQEWQALLVYDLLAVDGEGLYVHSKFGYSVPRRNGKNEVVSIRELYALHAGERVLHTAHRTTTSSSASKRLSALLDALGYQEVTRAKKGQTYTHAYTYSKQFGMERIQLLDEGGGTCDFRTRTSKGGLGEGFDLLVIDEAQEYQDDQESALKYVVSDSRNPQTIFCGTPPTAVSTGTVFTRLRTAALRGETVNTGWAEWSIDQQSDPRDKRLWYQTNPSLGTILTERKITDELGTDEVDFNIQRLGLWIRYNQKSAISAVEWDELKVSKLPALTGKLFVGVKYGHDGENAAMSIAVKTKDGHIFVETVDCRPVKAGNAWIIDFLQKANWQAVVIDGANGQSILQGQMKDSKMKKPLLPTVKEVIEANAAFEQALSAQTIRHAGQPSLVNVVSNCEKRAIGSNGGFGYRAVKDGAESALLDSVIYAFWACSKAKKEKRKRTVSY